MLKSFVSLCIVLSLATVSCQYRVFVSYGSTFYGLGGAVLHEECKITASDVALATALFIKMACAKDFEKLRQALKGMTLDTLKLESLKSNRWATAEEKAIIFASCYHAAHECAKELPEGEGSDDIKQWFQTNIISAKTPWPRLDKVIDFGWYYKTIDQIDTYLNEEQ